MTLNRRCGDWTIIERNMRSDFYEYEQGDCDILVRGRLKNCISFWRNIGASDFVLNTIQVGYKIPFMSTPEPAFMKNNRSALLHADFVSEAINDLVRRGLVAKCYTPPAVVNPLSVAIQSSGKKRLILDLRAVNKHLWKETVKYEDIRTALLFVKRGSWMFKFDIHSAYHHLDIFEPHTYFLGFSWSFEGRNLYFRFLVLPFGIRTAPYLFTKMTKPLVKKWRSEGKQVLMYLDDGFGCHGDQHVAQIISCEVKTDLINSGFVPKVEKSMWDPVQCLQFLGNILDTENGIIIIPDRRIEKALDNNKRILKDVKKKGVVHCRNVARFIGQIISMSIVVGNVTQLMTKCLSIDVLGAQSWDSLIKLSDSSLMQLCFWKDNLNSINSRLLQFDPSCTKVVYSDASGSGFGGYCVEMGGEFAHGHWQKEGVVKSSTWRELVAVLRVLIALKCDLKDRRIKWFTDNQNVVKIKEKGSMQHELQQISLDLYSVCSRHNISMEIEWIPRTENDRADFISRLIDHDDWGVSEALFRWVDAWWGPHEVDWFASTHNAMLPVFYTRYWSPGSAGIDAFTENWRGKKGWFVPPICLIARVLKHMEKCCCFGTIVVPYWPSASFWPILCSEGGHFGRAVKGWIDLPTGASYYVSGEHSGALFGKQDLKFRMLALSLDFRSV